MASVWRLNIKTAAKAGIDPRRFCLERGILGVGWQVEQTGDITWTSYISEAKPLYKSSGRSFTVAMNALKHRMAIGDLCWTRDHDATYYLGIVTSDWRYESGQAHRDADVANVRSCLWLRAGTVDVVPGRVVNSYISGSTVQKVNGNDVRAYSEYLANKLSGELHYCPSSPDKSFLGLLSSDDCEDLVPMYLQKEHGYLVIPSTCKADTAAYEYVLRHSITGGKAVAQVKHGAVDLDKAAYSDIDANVFLLTTRGKYVGVDAANVSCISPESATEFAVKNYNLMPARIKSWIDFDREVRT